MFQLVIYSLTIHILHTLDCVQCTMCALYSSSIVVVWKRGFFRFKFKCHRYCSPTTFFYVHTAIMSRPPITSSHISISIWKDTGHHSSSSGDFASGRWQHNLLAHTGHWVPHQTRTFELGYNKYKYFLPINNNFNGVWQLIDAITGGGEHICPQDTFKSDWTSSIAWPCNWKIMWLCVCTDKSATPTEI